MASTLDPKRLSEVFDALCEFSERLTPWEFSFVDSVHNQWLEGRTLTEKQLEVLEKIYVQRTP